MAVVYVCHKVSFTAVLHTENITPSYSIHASPTLADLKTFTYNWEENLILHSFPEKKGFWIMVLKIDGSSYYGYRTFIAPESSTC